jgi:hypothetical protein
MAAYNPGGASDCAVLPCTEDGNPRDEGYLYWLGWLSHVGNSTFQNQDAHGVYRRVFLAATKEAACAIVKDNPLADEIAEFDQIVSALPGSCPP